MFISHHNRSSSSCSFSTGNTLRCPYQDDNRADITKEEDKRYPILHSLPGISSKDVDLYSFGTIELPVMCILHRTYLWSPATSAFKYNNWRVPCRTFPWRTVVQYRRRSPLLPVKPFYFIKANAFQSSVEVSLHLRPSSPRFPRQGAHHARRGRKNAASSSVFVPRLKLSVHPQTIYSILQVIWRSLSRLLVLVQSHPCVDSRISSITMDTPGTNNTVFPTNRAQAVREHVL